MLALVREISPLLPQCELTHLKRTPIDLDLARAQHQTYASTLAEFGARIEWLPPLPDCPDGVFVEDTAVVLPELAIVARPGAASRRGEVDSVANALQRHRRLTLLSPEAQLDGGDVLVAGKRVYVGQSSRTNAAAARELTAILEPLGYQVSALAVSGCLHLKSACTFIPPRTLVINPDWVDPAAFPDFTLVPVSESEPWAANTVTLGGVTLVCAAFPETEARLRGAGLFTRALDNSELRKAEAGLSCCSILVPDAHLE